MSIWIPLISALIGTVLGGLISLGAQLLLFTQNARKDRIYRVRDALADFAAAGFAYLDARESLAGLAQRQLNATRSGPAALTPADSNSTQDEPQLLERERNADADLRRARERLQSSKARLYVLTDNKSLQAQTQNMWRRLDQMTPAGTIDPRENSEVAAFQTIPLLRDELDAWLAHVASQIPTLFWGMSGRKGG